MRYRIAEGNALAYVGRGISVGRLSVLALGFRVRNISLAPTGRYCIAQGNALAYVGRGISVVGYPCWLWVSVSPRKKYINLAPTGRYCIAEGNALAYVGRGISVGWLSVLALGFRISA